MLYCHCGYQSAPETECGDYISTRFSTALSTSLPQLKHYLLWSQAVSGVAQNEAHQQ